MIYLAQAAQRRSSDHIVQVLKGVEDRPARRSRDQVIEQALHPQRSLAAGCAFAARLAGVEGDQVAYDADDAALLVQSYDAAGPQDSADGLEGRDVEGCLR
jgi:hypothetical protein